MTAEIIPFKIERQDDGELRIGDVELATRLGFKNPADFRKLVKRYAPVLRRFGILATVAKIHSGAGRPGKSYLLSEQQSIFLCAKSETDTAIDITVELVRQFAEMRRAHSQQPITKELLRLNILSPEVRVWEKRFEKPFFDNLHRVMNLKKPGRNNHPNCGHFINRYVYEFLFGNLGLEIIREANPNALRTNSVGENEYRRAYRHHQMLKSEHIPAFKQHIRTLNTLLGVSTSIGHFDDIFNATFPKHHTQIGFMFNELQKNTPTQEARR